MASSAGEKLLEQLNCSICLERYTKPRTLPCHHSFCQDCLGRLLVEVREGKCFVRCPTCRSCAQLPDNGVAGLPPAYLINNLLEVAESFSKLALKETQTTNQDESPHCQDHTRPMNVFCETCQKLICLSCTRTNHCDHDYDFVTVLFDRHKEEMESATLFQDDLIKAEHKLQALKGQEEWVNKQTSAVNKTIDTWIEELHQALETSRDRLKERTVAVAKGNAEAIYLQRSTVELAMAEVQSCQNSMTHVLKTHSPAQVLSKKTELMEHFDQARKMLAKVTSLKPPPKTCMHLEKETVLIEQVGRAAVIHIPDRFVATGRGSRSAMAWKKASFSFTFSNTSGCIPLHLISCQLSSPTAMTHCSIASIGRNGQYQASYTASSCGPHNLEMKVGDVTIPGTPIIVNVLPSPAMRFEPLRIIGIQHPHGLAVTKEGMVLVTQGTGHITTLNSEGQLVGSIQLPLGCKPTGVAVMRDGRHILVVDPPNHQLLKLTLEGELVARVGMLGSGRLQFNNRSELSVHPETGQIFIVEYGGNCSVQVLNEDLSFAHRFGKKGTGPGQFLCMGDVAFDSTGMVYITDCRRRNVQKFTLQGKYVLTFGADVLRGPECICIDSNDIVYVSDSFLHQVHMFTIDGSYIRNFIIYRMPGSFCGLRVDQCGTLVLSDHSNNRVVFY